MRASCGCVGPVSDETKRSQLLGWSTSMMTRSAVSAVAGRPSLWLPQPAVLPPPELSLAFSLLGHPFLAYRLLPPLLLHLLLLRLLTLLLRPTPSFLGSLLDCSSLSSALLFTTLLTLIIQWHRLCCLLLTSATLLLLSLYTLSLMNTQHDDNYDRSRIYGRC